MKRLLLFHRNLFDVLLLILFLAQANRVCVCVCAMRHANIFYFFRFLLIFTETPETLTKEQEEKTTNKNWIKSHDASLLLLFFLQMLPWIYHGFFIIICRSTRRLYIYIISCTYLCLCVSDVFITVSHTLSLCFCLSVWLAGCLTIPPFIRLWLAFLSLFLLFFLFASTLCLQRCIFDIIRVEQVRKVVSQFVVSYFCITIL